MKRKSTRILALAAAGSLVFAACGGDDGESSDTSGVSTEAPSDSEAPMDTEAPSGDAWAVNTDDCVDPDAANAPIEGTVKIGSTMPLSGGLAATAFAPVKDGFEAYIKYANEKKLLGDITIEVTIGDDQYNKDLTPGKVDELLDADVDLFSAMIGTSQVASVRDLLNEECYPQLMSLTGDPRWGDAENYPWTTGILIPYDVESKAYAKVMGEMFPDGGDVALFTVNSDFGQPYVDAFTEAAPEFNLTIVEEQTVEATDSNPPTAQLNAIAAAAPDAILAVPLGAGCVTFLTELANTKAANPGWEPKVFVTATCASALILGAAGAAADGLYTAANLVDVLDPETAALPAVAEYIAYMESLGKSEIITTAGAGWHAAEMTVAVLKKALESGVLSRASIINAARNLDVVGMLTREGVRMKTSGLEDQYITQSLQVVQYNATTTLFTDIGTLVTDFES